MLNTAVVTAVKMESNDELHQHIKTLIDAKIGPMQTEIWRNKQEIDALRETCVLLRTENEVRKDDALKFKNDILKLQKVCNTIDELKKKLDTIDMKVQQLDLALGSSVVETNSSLVNELNMVRRELLDAKEEVDYLKRDVEASVGEENDASEEDNFKCHLLSQSIYTESMKLNLHQHIDENKLQVFKFPLELRHSVPANKLRSFCHGEPRPDEDHRYVLLTGMTGAGKSLCINNMVNYIYGVKYSDDFRFKVIIESEEIAERGERVGSSQAESMTSWVTGYTFHWQEGFRIPFSLTVIDTPGFGSTYGIQHDEIIVGQINKFLNDDRLYPSQELSSIGLLVQSSMSRITAEQKYIFDQVLNMFGKDMEKSISIMFTFADDLPPPALELVVVNRISLADNCKFHFNNSAMYMSRHSAVSKYNFSMCYDSLRKYFENLQTKKPIDLTMTKHVLEEREHLRATLAALEMEILSGIEKLCLIEEEKMDIKNRNVYSIQFVDHNVTNCNTCKRTCHNPCDELTEQCSSMQNSYCKVCPANCPFYMHTPGDMVYVYRDEDEETVVPTENIHPVDIEGMLEKYRKQKETVFYYIKKAFESSNRLDNITLRASCLTNVEYIERLIQSEERSSRPNKRNRINQLYYFVEVAENLRDTKLATCDIPTIRFSKYEDHILKMCQNW